MRFLTKVSCAAFKRCSESNIVLCHVRWSLTETGAFDPWHGRAPSSS